MHLFTDIRYYFCMSFRCTAWWSDIHRIYGVRGRFGCRILGWRFSWVCFSTLNMSTLRLRDLRFVVENEGFTSLRVTAVSRFSLAASEIPSLSSSFLRFDYNVSRAASLLIFPAWFFLLRYNWHIALYLFLAYNLMIWYFYILCNDHHNKSSIRLCSLALFQYVEKTWFHRFCFFRP